ncbi:MAG: glutamate mutase L [Candidatus Cloacimonetes bacterium]|nr:glutamate mutase L [Candidatus Cloacimonadota bacterium]
MRLDQDYIVITDIGSTTTKALLLDNRQDIPVLLDIAHAETTVEAPQSDVRHGIKASVRALQEKSGIQLLDPAGKDGELAFTGNTAYFSTSSAGGGLQILVIGLTLYDSASSGKRCAYGAGGVILDTFALDDKRQAAQQMLAMRNLHPDMILLCGGTDGGAISGVLRMAEILRIANPAPKFDLRSKIPALYAGNQDAAPIVKKLISQAFDLHILPNLRPSLEVENLQPTQDMIQKLFMENVMEQAPGYSEVKPEVAAPIIPTPLGVQRALALLAEDQDREIFAFDIGGATTDVFSYIRRHFQRTVSANLGMSYSAWNVLREAGLENVKRWLPQDLGEREIRNYIANKCLHPTSNPVTANDYRIEHALAREALALALEQHRQMHYNSEKIGYLDKLKRNDLEKFELQFEFQREDSKHSFRESDIDVLIGAGGIFAHAMNHNQCALILADSVRPKGITELWIDRDFITPHLGVLSDTDPQSSKTLLHGACIAKLAVHISPIFNFKESKTLMTVEVNTQAETQSHEIQPDSFLWLPAGPKTLKITLSNRCKLSSREDLNNFATELPVLIDTRLDLASHLAEVEKMMALYPNAADPLVRREAPRLEPKAGTWLRRVELPYAGDINFSAGDPVQPDDVVAVNRFNPPRLYIISGLANIQDLEPKQIEASLKVQPGDTIEADEAYAEIPPEIKLALHYRGARKLFSPVRGRIEYVDAKTGMLVASEIQDYSGKPLTVNFAEKLMLSPKKAARYLTKAKGDFVYQGDMIARRLEKTADGGKPVLIKAPGTGTITAIDTTAGTLTITYLHKPLEFLAHVKGMVQNVVPGQSLEISYPGVKLEGQIAFGRARHGAFTLLNQAGDAKTAEVQDKVVALAFPPDREMLNTLAGRGARAVICHEMDATELTEWLDFEPGVINTGNEDLPLTVLILSGFGDREMPPELRRELALRNTAYLNPHTRIRAGVVRPFLCF